MIEQHEIDKWAKRIILFLDKEQGIDRAKEEAKKKLWLEKRNGEWMRKKHLGVEDYRVSLGGGGAKRGMS